MKSGDKFKRYDGGIYTLQKLPDFDLWILVAHLKDNQGNLHPVQWKGIDEDSTTPMGAFGGCFSHFTPMN